MFELVKSAADAGVLLSAKDGQLHFDLLVDEFPSRLKDKIIAHKAELIQYLLTLAQSEHCHEPAAITAVSKDDGHYPLSYSQQRIWLIDKIQADSAEYNMPVVFKIRGPLDVRLVERVMTIIVGRHAILRSTYFEAEHQVFQHIRPATEITFKLKEHSLTGLNGDEQALAVQRIVKQECTAAFDLARDLLVRANYISLTADEGILLFNMHHIVSDGWSMEILKNEFFMLYQGYAAGREVALPQLPIQYADYACWQHGQQQKMKIEEQLHYWLQQLDGVAPLHRLPLDYPRSDSRQHQGGRVHGLLSPEIAENLTKLARMQKMSPFMLMHAALAQVLAVHSGSNDILIGTAVANRMQPDLESLIGFFVNTLVLRLDTAHTSLADYLSHVRQVHLDAQAHQSVPFEYLIEALKVPRSAAYNPLFQIMLTTNSEYGVDATDGFNLAGAELTPMRDSLNLVKFDLEINLTMNEQGVSVSWLYDASLFSEQHIDQLNEHLCRLLTKLANVVTLPLTVQSQLKLADLSMLSELEQEHLLAALSPEHKEYPTTACVHELFEQQVGLTPDKVALTFKGQKLTYQALNARANQLAHYLSEHYQTGPDTLIGLCIGRSPEMVIAALAILKTGAAYVPLDPDYPDERLAYIAEDADLALVLAVATTIPRLSAVEVNTVVLDEVVGKEPSDWPFSRYPTDNLDAVSGRLTSRHLAYVIYTSGSTGEPKGVLTPHIAIARLVIRPNFMPLNNETVFLQSSSFAFDAATLELWGPLLNGGHCVLYSGSEMDLNILMADVERDQVNAMWLTAGLFDVWSHMNVPKHSLKYVLAGGDVLKPEAVQRVLEHSPGVTVINGYGPTENTTFSCCYQVQPQLQYDNIPIGKGLQGDVLLILDNNLSLCPMGAVGELFVGGDGLARGYLKKPELTAQRFIQNPYLKHGTEHQSHRLYRTGDLVRRLPDGNLEFIGRTDEQVKIHGFRVEPAEVGYQLEKHIVVDSALVVARPVAGTRQLVAYIRLKQDAIESSSEADCLQQIRSAIAAKLPEYMWPAVMVCVESWPLTRNGKIDRRALPDAGRVAADTYQAPMTDTEQLLAGVWSRLLRLPAAGLSANASFFGLGGHSLLAIRMQVELSQLFQIDLSVGELFRHKTLAELAGFIDGQKRSQQLAIPRISRHDPVPLSEAQYAVWLSCQLSAEHAQYNIPVVLKMHGQLDLATVCQVLNQLIARHEALRTTFHEAGGACFQQVNQVTTVEVPMVDLRSCNPAKQSALLREMIEHELVTSFDLCTDLMLRAKVFHLADDEFVLSLVLHHISADGWSIEILKREFSQLYQGIRNQAVVPLAELPLQYADYAAWSRRQQADRLTNQYSYWRRQLEACHQIHNLPTDKVRPQIQEFAGGVCELEIPEALSCELKALAQQKDVTLFVLLKSIFAVLIAKWSHEADLVIGMPVAGRHMAGMAQVVGMFVNMLPIRFRIGTEQPFSELLRLSQQTIVAAYDHQDVSFHTLVEQLELERNLSHHPVFQIVFSHQTLAAPIEHIDGLVMDSVEAGATFCKYDLNVQVSEHDRGLSCHWSYAMALFHPHSVERMAQAFVTLCRQIVQDPDIRVASLSLLDVQQTRALIQKTAFRGKDDLAGRQRNLVEYFEHQVSCTPDHIAVEFGKAQLSYQALNTHVNMLAHRLLAAGIRKGALVAIYCERSIDMLVAMLAVVKTGAGYIPVEYRFRADKLAGVLKRFSVDLVLVGAELHAHLPEDVVAWRLDGLGDGNDQTHSYPQHNPGITIDMQDTIYVISTSGSTGEPKGVEVTHLGLIDYCLNAFDVYYKPHLAGSKMITSHAFDISMPTIYLPLLSGGTVSLLATGEELPQLAECIAASERPFLQRMTPTQAQGLLALLEPQRCFTARHVFLIGGEKFPAFLAQELRNRFPEAHFLSQYGPSETVIGCTLYDINATAISRETLALGKPNANTGLYVLDPQKHVLPEGCVGELYVGALGLAKGYYKAPELTAQKFSVNPFRPNERLYQTGDLVRWLPDGQLEFVGRTDEQVKLRGFRVELGEIRALMMKVPQVADAFVIIRGQAATERMLGYIVTTAVDKKALLRDVNSFLRQQLPDYMVPSGYCVLEQLPLSANGKVDHKLLPEPELQQETHDEPDNDIERRLVEVWKELLGPDLRISTHVSFFELGGHSLTATRMLGMVQKQFNISISLRNIFEYNNIKSLATLIQGMLILSTDDADCAEVCEDEGSI